MSARAFSAFYSIFHHLICLIGMLFFHHLLRLSEWWCCFIFLFQFCYIIKSWNTHFGLLNRIKDNYCIVLVVCHLPNGTTIIIMRMLRLATDNTHGDKDWRIILIIMILKINIIITLVVIIILSIIMMLMTGQIKPQPCPGRILLYRYPNRKRPFPPTYPPIHTHRYIYNRL